MANKKAVVENTTPLAELTTTPPENGASPPEVEKTIKLIELQEDLTQLVKGLETLQKQVVAQMGAIQYINQKIAKLSGDTSEGG